MEAAFYFSLMRSLLGWRAAVGPVPAQPAEACSGRMLQWVLPANSRSLTLLGPQMAAQGHGASAQEPGRLGLGSDWKLQQSRRDGASLSLPFQAASQARPLASVC